MASVKPITGPQVGVFASKLMAAGVDGDAFELLLERNNHLKVCTIIDELMGRNNPLLSGDWLDRIVTMEAQALKAFYGQEVDMSLFHDTLKASKLEKMQRWLALNHTPHFTPPSVLTRETELPGWNKKPDEFYWQNLASGNFYRMVEGKLVKVVKAELLGQVILTDNRPKPQYTGGKQMWHGDKTFLAPVMQRLRKEGALSTYDYGSQASRFGASANEIQEFVRPAAAELLGLNPEQVMLEPTLVANLIPQIHPTSPRGVKDDTTNTWCWYDEYFEGAGRRVCGGCSARGGLAYVDWYCAAGRYYDIGFRLQGVLATQTLGS